jgi:GrpB-like predicted nucleotidyltransferase (UPF0157 family)
LGYAHRGDLGIRGREAFRAPPSSAKHHLYVCPAGNEELRRHLLFRDYLRAHADVANRYADLKRQLADRFAADRVAYTNGKATFVDEVLRAAEASAQVSGREETPNGSYF